MANYKKEWWDSEIAEKFRGLNLIVFYLCFTIGMGKIAVHLSGLYIFGVSDIFYVGLPILLSQLSFYFNWIPSTGKVAYAFLLTELLNLTCLKLGEDYSEGDKVVLQFTASIILVCLQLSFFYSPISTTLLILKFFYQWYAQYMICLLYTSDAADE